MSPPLDIVLYGEAAHCGSGAYCYAETLREMGHHVEVASEAVHFEKYARPALRVLRKLRGRPLEVHRRRNAGELLGLARRAKPQIVIVLKGLHIAADDVRALRAGGAWVVNINHDDFFSRNKSNWSVVQRRALPAYDFVFATREVNVAEVRPLNPNVEFFPFAYYPRIHRPLPVTTVEDARFASDVVFVGTWERERCELLERLVTAVPARYAIWGSFWSRAGRRSPLRPFIRGGDVRGDDMAKALGGAEIALGFLRKSNRDDYTQRTFEIPACGGLLLAERTARHLTFYREGIEAEFFDPERPDELVSRVRALLSDPERRTQIRAAGLAALQRQAHTYRDRLERLLWLYAQRP
jgi:spore maturation protein CgeB